MKEEKLIGDLNKNWLKALHKSGDSLIVVKAGRVVFRGKSRGVSDLLYCAKSDLLKGSTVYDTKIGLAVAKISFWFNVSALYGLLVTKAAKKFCKERTIALRAKNVVEKLYEGVDAGCVLERAAFKSNDIESFIEAARVTGEVRAEKCPYDGVFPLNYFTTSNRKTLIYLASNWVSVSNTEMDKGILIDRRISSASCVSSSEIKKGDLVVVGEVGQGIKEERRESEKDLHFGFMVSDVSGERSKEVMIGNVASQIREMKNSGQRVLFVGGPAIIHTGAGKYLARLIKSGFIDVIFAGNALATHDLEESYFGTSLGVEIKSAVSVVGGHHHHLRTINAVRFYGGIRNFVKAERVGSGIFYECMKRGTKYILAGSIRDDGPLTDVITDSIAAQMEMRKEVRKGFGMAVMVATTLHSVATGNLLPATVKKVIVDDNLAAVTKLADRGTNALGIVTDCAYFLSELCRKLSV